MERTAIEPSWPNALRWFLAQGLGSFTPWHLLKQPAEFAFAARAFQREDTGGGELFMFARRQDRDDFAGLEMRDGKVTDKVVCFHPVFSLATPKHVRDRTWSIVSATFDDVFDFVARKVIPDMKEWAEDEDAKDL